MTDLLCTAFMIVGAVFMVLAGIGILRMPDIFMRMSCSSKAGTLGIGCLMIATALYFRELHIVCRALAIGFFTMFTAPVAAHMIGRAGYIAGIPLWKNSVVDQLCHQYDRCNHTADSDPEEPPV